MASKYFCFATKNIFNGVHFFFLKQRTFVRFLQAVMTKIAIAIKATIQLPSGCSLCVWQKSGKLELMMVGGEILRKISATNLLFIPFSSGMIHPLPPAYYTCTITLLYTSSHHIVFKHTFRTVQGNEIRLGALRFPKISLLPWNNFAVSN